MAGLAQSMSGGGMGGLIPMAFKRKEDGDSSPPPIAAGAIPAFTQRKRPEANATRTIAGGQTPGY